MLRDGQHPETVAYLADELTELRCAITAEDDDQLIELLDRVHDKAGRHATYLVLGELLRYAHNVFTDSASAACIEIATQRYQARFTAQ